MRSPLTLIITAAGEGRRFREMGIHKSKPLIKVHDRSLLEHTLESFTLQSDDEIVITTRRSLNISTELGVKLKEIYPTLNIRYLELDFLPQGQLATALITIENIISRRLDKRILDRTLLIHNCDTGFCWDKACLPSETDASMTVFEANGDHWSFGKPSPVDPNLAIAIAEKQRISSLASIGLYGFKSESIFMQFAKWQISNGSKIRNEHYIAPLLQHLIERGLTVSLPRIKHVKLYGTPMELCQTFGITLNELKEANR